MSTYISVRTDKVDLDIIECLKDNGRISNNEIADRLSISEGTVRNRIRRMIREKFLSIKGLINPDKITEKQVIFLGAKVAMSKDLEKTAEAVSKLPQVNSISIVTGRFDLLIEIFMEPHAVINFMSKDLAALNSIISTETFMTLKTYNKWV